MSAAADTSYPATEDNELTHYRSVSRAAVVSLVLGGLSVLALAFAELLILPVVGLVMSLVGLSTIRRYPAEYTGSRLATAGALLSGAFLIGGASWHTYAYLTEVPEGYVRADFYELQPEPDYPELPVSRRAIDLSGQKIFIKGYVHPGVASMGKVQRFILVPDMGTCCFGGDPKATDMIEVHIPDPAQRLAYSRRRVKLAGTFGVSQIASQSLQMKNPVWYHLEVNEVR